MEAKKAYTMVLENQLRIKVLTLLIEKRYSNHL